MTRGDDLRASATRAGTVQAVLALALGRPLRDAGALDWDEVLLCAEREGCAPLCWSRSGALVRAHAPTRARDRFRAIAVAVAERAARQLATLAEVMDALETAGASPVALKGAALAQLAHGDPLVRQSADVDVLVPRTARAAAARALEARGWRRVGGAAPWEETWLRGDGELLEHLEVQSAPFGEMLVHLEPAASLPATDMRLADARVRVLAPAALPAYLAVHLSRHRLAPLLWWVDLAALWASYDAPARAEARAFARGAGLHRYLEWGLARADAARRGAEGDAPALAMLGRVGAEGRAIGHPAWRDARFAPGAGARLRVIGAWAVPPTTRGTPASMLARALRRLRRAAGLVAPDDRVSPAVAEPPSARALDVTREQLADLVEAAVAAGGPVWMRAHGRSMRPAIPSEALVRLVPPPRGALPSGAVVLARLADGSFALHRVLEEHDGTVRMRGDAVVTDDAPVARAAVLAVADLVDAGDGPRPLARREPLTVFRVLRPLRRIRLRLRARRAGRVDAREAHA